MNDLYEVLEICLRDIEQGADIDTVLFRYPELADELRPILETSVNARSLMVSVPSAEVVRRNRAKVLQQAAQMREAKIKPSARRIWFTSLRRVAVTLVVVAMLFASGTGLVRAASTTLPGDNLYPVKRTWEDVLLLFTFNLKQREALEVEHENERLYELHEVFAEGRSTEVDFKGLVTSQNGNEWVVSGIQILISAQTETRDQGIGVGSAVRVIGQTQGDDIVLAERIRLLPPGSILPNAGDDEPEVEEENNEGPNQQSEDNSGKGSEGETPKVEETKGPESESGSKDESSNDGSNSGSNDSSLDDNSNNSGSNSNDNSGGSGSDDNSNDSGGGNSGPGGGGDSGGGDNSGSGGGGGG